MNKWASFFVMIGAAFAWDIAPHQAITSAALEALPDGARVYIGSESKALIEIYCMLPDRYAEMEHFGFTRKSAGPQTAAEIQEFCVRPDGVEVHSAIWDREEDLASILFLFERILRSLQEHRTSDAARFLGTLSHFIADSTSPPHAVPAADLATLASVPDGHAIHLLLERRIPPLRIDPRSVKGSRSGLLATANDVLDRCYKTGARNRQDLPAMIRAALNKDEKELDRLRFPAAKDAAEILSDTVLALTNLVAQ